MKRRFVVMLVAMLVVLAAPTVAQAGFSAQFRAALLARINHYRVTHGRRSVSGNTQLHRSAAAHSSDMARHRMLSHSASTGASWERRIRYWGFRGTYIGENLAAGAFTARGVMRAWRASAEHRANLLSTRYKVVGLGVSRGSWGGRPAVYVTVDFGGS